MVRLTAFVLAALALPAAANAQVDLKHKLQPGAKVEIRVDTKTEQELVIGGMNVPTKADNWPPSRLTYQPL